jgi:hypothetical protein
MAAPVVTFPQAATLTAILTDLNWRHVALEWDTRPFYQHVADSIGEQSYPRFFLRNDPIGRWIEGHRARFATSASEAGHPRLPEILGSADVSLAWCPSGGLDLRERMPEW